jgi:signal transduction histidine kinase
LQRIAEAAVPLAWNQGRVEIVSRISGTLPQVLADPERLEQIIWNLITNAVRHTPPGGLVLIGAEPVEDQLEIEVRDTGDGIDPAELPLIWDRFYRASNARDRAGAGLGLALVRELTEAMGGTVAVESEPGEGSRFSIRLPLAPASIPSAPVPSLTS